MKRRQENHSKTGLKALGHGPQRMCLACRSRRSPRELLRLACSSERQVIVDQSGRLPGRGAYVCFQTDCLRRALKPATLASAFRQPVTAPTFDAVYEGALGQLHGRLRQAVSMARRAGAVISGHALLCRALAQRQIVCLVVTQDIAPARADEYRAWCAKLHIPCWTLFTKESLGSLIGRSNRSAVGLTDSRFYGMLRVTVASLETLCAGTVSAEATSGLL